MTVSGESGLITYVFESIEKISFKYLKCYSWPMVVASCTIFSHILQKCITFWILHWPSSQQPSLPPFFVDSFLTEVECIRWAEQWVLAVSVGGQECNERKFISKDKGWTRQGYEPSRAQNWLKWKWIHSTSHYSTLQNCTATHGKLL